MIEEYPVSAAAALLSFPGENGEEWAPRVVHSLQFPGILLPAKTVTGGRWYWFVGYLDYRFENFRQIGSYLSGGEGIPLIRRIVRKNGLRIYPQVGARKLAPLNVPVPEIIEKATSITPCNNDETIDAVLANLVDIFVANHTRDNVFS